MKNDKLELILDLLNRIHYYLEQIIDDNIEFEYPEELEEFSSVKFKELDNEFNQNLGYATAWPKFFSVLVIFNDSHKYYR